MTNTDDSPDDLITSARVRRRLGNISDMSLWRWSRDPHLEFPQPIYINGRRYWRPAELKEWEEKQRKRAMTSTGEAA